MENNNPKMRVTRTIKTIDSRVIYDFFAIDRGDGTLPVRTDAIDQEGLLEIYNVIGEKLKSLNLI